MRRRPHWTRTKISAARSFCKLDGYPYFQTAGGWSVWHRLGGLCWNMFFCVSDFESSFVQRRDRFTVWHTVHRLWQDPDACCGMEAGAFFALSKMPWMSELWFMIMPLRHSSWIRIGLPVLKDGWKFHHPIELVDFPVTFDPSDPRRIRCSDQGVARAREGSCFGTGWTQLTSVICWNYIIYTHVCMYTYT